MAPQHQLTLELHLGSAAAAGAVAAALGPELPSLESGTTAEVRAEGPLVVLTVRARDVGALRTAQHGLLRLAQAAQGSLIAAGSP